MLLKCDLGEASEFARMQACPLLGFELFQRFQADLKMLSDPLAIELVGHTGELDFTMERLVRDAEQGAIGHAEAEAVSGDRCRLHIERDSARLRQTPDDARIADLPVAIIYTWDRSGAHHALQLESRELCDL